MVQTVGNSDGIPERFFFKTLRRLKNMENYLVCNELKAVAQETWQVKEGMG